MTDIASAVSAAESLSLAMKAATLSSAILPLPLCTVFGTAGCPCPGLDGGVVGGSILVFDELALLVAESCLALR